MTSHYMECIVKDSLERVFEAVSEKFGNVYAKKLSDMNTARVGVILGEQWFFRVNSDVAVLITLKEVSTTQTKLEAVSCAGGAGLISIS